MSIVRIILNLLLVAFVAFLGWKLVNDIKGPIEFEDERTKRYAATVVKLKEIRKAQIMYKRKYENYMGDLDTLKQFIINDSVMIVNQIGDPNDSTVVVRKDTSWVMVLDSLYKIDKNTPKELDKVPFGNGEKFMADAGEITKNKVKVKVFKVWSNLGTIYDGLNRQYFDPKEELFVGSMEDATTSGNWE